VEQWDEIKARERAAAGRARESVLDGLPTALPALSRARDLGSRAAGVGFDWPDAGAVLHKLGEGLSELQHEVAAGEIDRAVEELGDLLFAAAQLARKLGVDPEGALRAANRKFTARFQALERTVAAEGRDLSGLTLDELEAVWQRVKNMV
jgi:ATP diphosphatase